MSLAPWCDLGLTVVIHYLDHVWQIQLAWIRVTKNCARCGVSNIERVVRCHDNYNLDPEEIRQLLAYSGPKKLVAVLDERIGRLVTAANERDDKE